MGVGAAWRPEAAAFERRGRGPRRRRGLKSLLKCRFSFSKTTFLTTFARKSIKVSFFISKNDTFYDFLFAGVQRRSEFTYFQIGDAICEKRRNSHQNGH